MIFSKHLLNQVNTTLEPILLVSLYWSYNLSIIWFQNFLRCIFCSIFNCEKMIKLLEKVLKIWKKFTFVKNHWAIWKAYLNTLRLNVISIMSCEPFYIKHCLLEYNWLAYNWSDETRSRPAPESILSWIFSTI